MKPEDKILITGASGMLGRAITEELRRNGYAGLLTPNREALDLTSRESTINYVKIHKPDYIFHLASLVYGLKGNQNNQTKSLIENTKIYTNLLEALGTSHIPRKIFFGGTVASYAYPYKAMPLNERDFFDGLPHFGEFGYAMAKRHAFPYLELLKRDLNVEYVYGLYTNLYGPHDRFDTTNGHVIPSLISKAVSAARDKKRTFTVWGNQDSSRDFMYVKDAAMASVLLMNNGNGMTNICTGTTTSMHDLAWSISTSLDGAVTPVWDKSEPIGIQNREISPNILQSLGFTPKYSIAKGIKTTIDWYINSQEIRN